ncbi:MAG TPA: sugar phosphate nucleotidyltransferase, partial [Candidatus Caenarcaniphilales bacterium]
AQAFIIGREFIGVDKVALVLGDNIFYGDGFIEKLQRATKLESGAVVFGYWVKDPQRYGVVEFDAEDKPVGLEEKPQHPKSNYVVTGLYFYDNQVVEVVRHLKPSTRGELEITDVNKAYMRQGQLHVEKLSRGVAWLDTGTHESLLQASSFVETIEQRQGLKIACIEEVAYRMGYISAEQMLRLGSEMQKNGYGQYLMNLIATEKRLS